MQLRDPRDFHFIAICLSHQLADAQQLAGLLQQLDSEPHATLGELLLREGYLSVDQYQTIVREVLANARLVSVLEGQTVSAGTSSYGAAADTLTLELDEDLADAATICIDVDPEDNADDRPPADPLALADTGFNDFAEEMTALLSTPPDSPASYSQSLGSLSQGASVSAGSLSGSLDSLASGRSLVASFSSGLRERRPPEKLIGTEIAGYTIEGVLGKGGQGQVFKARQRSLNRIVALKTLPPDVAQDESFISRFLAEARTLATFTHPNVVQVYDVGIEDGVYYFVMEAVNGQTLKDLLTAQGKLPVEVGVNLMKQCLRGLERAGREGIIHRDIKPGNILIDDQGIVKLVDFGLAERVNATGTLDTSKVVGTPLYVSPEQIRGRDVSSRSDQYSLGASFYHLLTGQPPYQGRNSREVLSKHLDESLADPCVLAPEIHSELGAILQRMMAKEPAERYESFQQLFKVLEDFELRHGLIESRSTFLAEGLINIGERSVRALGAKIGLGVVIGIGTTAAAIGASELLDRTGHSAWKVSLGNLGAVLLLLAFAAIMYIAAVRKKWLPKLGNVRLWLQAHIAMALIGYFLSQVHSGNFLKFLTGPESLPVPGTSPSWNLVPVIPFLNSFLFTTVVASGLVGRYIWRDIAKQVATERIQRGEDRAGLESHEITLSIFAQRALRYWRIFHYPMAFALIIVTIVHVVSILYFGGGR